MAKVQDWNNQSATNLTTLTVTVSGATVGNMLVLGISLNNDDTDSIDAVPGWELIAGSEFNNTGQGANYKLAGAFFWRIATGDSNDDAAVSWATACKSALRVREMDDEFDPADPLKAFNLDRTKENTGGAGSVGTGAATPTSDTGFAIAMLFQPRRIDWSASNNDSGNNISLTGSFTDKTMLTASNTSPIMCMMNLSLSDTSEISETWATTQAGSQAVGAIVIFNTAPAPWELSGIDGEQIDDGGTLVSELTVTSDGGTVLGTAFTLASDDFVSRWFIQHTTGSGTGEISVDGGVAWSDVTSLLNDTTYEPVMVGGTLANPQIAFRGGTTGDVFRVRNAECLQGQIVSNVVDAGEVVTGDAQAQVFQPCANIQVGAWDAPNWSLIEGNSRNNPANEGKYNIFYDTLNPLTLGSELITNGDFSDGINDWTAPPGTISVEDDTLKIVTDGGAYGYALQDIVTVPGNPYFLVLELAGAGTSLVNYIQVGTVSSSASIINQDIGVAVDTYKLDFVATEAITRVSMVNGFGVTLHSFWDNVSVKEIISGLDTAIIVENFDSGGWS